MSRLAVPEMVRTGYPKDVSVAITAAGGLLAPIIPPSMIFIIFGVVAQVPIGDLFAAGIVPGLLLFLVFVGVIGVVAHRRGFPSTPRSSWPERFGAVKDALPSALIPVTIIGSILGGLATPTEAAAVASLMAVLVGLFVYRELTVADIGCAFVNAAKGAAVVLFLVAAAQVFSWVITFENVPATVAEMMRATTSSPTVFLLLVTALLLGVGMVMDPIPAIILIVPVLLPIATIQYGIDPIQFGMVVCINLTAGLLTPPVGTGLFTAALLNDIRAERIAWLLVPYLAAVVMVILLLIVFPSLSAIFTAGT
jgi:tripartite ATP-independent transporter DctM subunit